MGSMKEEQHTVPRSELFVRSIPSDITEDQLAAFFSDFAPVKHAVIVKDKESGESKGFGFVSFGSSSDAELARVEGIKQPIAGGRRLHIDVAKPRTRENGKEPLPLDASSELDREKRRPRIIVRNCPWSLRNPSELIKIFSKFGKVADAYIPRGENNRMSGFAFVIMKRKRHAKRAVEESRGLTIHDRPVTVDLAVNKEKWVSRGQSKLEDSESESESDSNSDSDSDSEEGVKAHNSAEDESNEEDKDSDENDEDSETETSKVKLNHRPLDQSYTIFVRNVPYDATGESLTEHFQQFGPVAYALPVFDKVKNYPKGTAFVAFKKREDCRKCLDSAPESTGSTLLVPDDVDPRYVYDGRVLSVSAAVRRDTAERLTEKRSNERLEALGKAPKQKDKRRIFLLNEGRIASNSKLAELLPKADLDIRENSFKLRQQQLQKNPSLHLSMTRLAIRNLPRVMNEKALKALARKAVVQFATEVKEKRRHPLTKEEILRSVQYQDSIGGEFANSKKHGVVRQAKIIQELKGSGEAGRSRGYGFLEMRNHKSALMALRWLNAHAVTPEEIHEGDPEADLDGRRHLVVEFAIENAQVVKRQRERQFRAQEKSKKRKASELEEAEREQEATPELEPAAQKKGNTMIGRKRKNKKAKKGN